MSEEGMLFGDIPVVKSPRLRWIESHGVKTRCEQPKCQEDEYIQWRAWNAHTNACFGRTEDDAIVNWAIANGVRLWFDEGV